MPGERAEEEPVEGKSAAGGRAHLLAQRADDVVASQQEEERGRGPREPRALAGLDPHEAGQEFPGIHRVQPAFGAFFACASCHAARTAASRSAVSPALSFACRSAGCVFHHASVSLQVSFRGRNVRPLPTAFALRDFVPVRVLAGRREPAGEVAPRGDLLRLEEVRGDPREARVAAIRGFARVEERPDGHGVARRVEDADGLRVEALHDPVAEVAHVDELDGVFRCVRREDLAALRDADGPVREAVADVVRADDEAGADVRDAARHRGLGRALAGGLEGPVVPLRDLVGVRVLELADGRRLVDARLAHVGEDGDRRDEDVLLRLREEGGRRGDLLREVARRVHDGVPGAALERLQVAVAVALEVLELREPARVGLAAVEERDLPAALLRGLDDLGAEKARPAEDQERFRFRPRKEAVRPQGGGGGGSGGCLQQVRRVWVKVVPPRACAGDTHRTRSCSSGPRAGLRLPTRSSRRSRRSPPGRRPSVPGGPRWPG